MIVIGFAMVERESWVLCGFDPQSEVEAARLEQERSELGFCPRLRSHELTACKNDQAKRSPKRALNQLTGNDRNRERQCWTETRLDVLRERGRDNGLTEYLEEVRTRLGPLFGHVPSQ